MNECNDPDHGAIYAERSESRGLRKAWIEADDKRQQLERELTTVTDQRDAITLRLGRTQEKMFDAEKQRDGLIKAIEPLKYWRDISECDCSNPLPQGGCLRCDLERILNNQ